MCEISLTMKLLPGCYGICRLDKGSETPSWAVSGDLFSVTRTAEELSVVCPEQNIPDGVKAERDWRILKVIGPLDFSLTGILAAISSALAASQISLFALSTYDTDYILVKEKDIDWAIDVLKKEQFEIEV
ncbi:MAG: ACT domain-containing protein [Clostridia bacterium]|nr:ACT domain-containing protein [Clostridia bacterium]